MHPFQLRNDSNIGAIDAQTAAERKEGMTMTIQEMNERKQELGYTYQQIAELAGLPLSTVQKVLGGRSKSPRRNTVLALEKVLRRTVSKERAYDHRHFFDNNKMTGFFSEFSVQEGVSAYQSASEKKQGEYTLTDYYQLPDGERVELIDGVIYDMTAPTLIHQLITGQLYFLLMNLIEKLHASCIPFISPVDVRLDQDDRTMVEPDILVICSRENYTPKRLEGAPDFVIEVLSPSTRNKDMYVKLYKYKNAGVREYWIVDPVQKRVIVYEFQKEDRVSVYSFRDRIPIGILDGSAAIDFAVVDDYIHPFMQEDDG